MSFPCEVVLNIFIFSYIGGFWRKLRSEKSDTAQNDQVEQPQLSNGMVREGMLKSNYYLICLLVMMNWQKEKSSVLSFLQIDFPSILSTVALPSPKKRFLVWRAKQNYRKT